MPLSPEELDRNDILDADWDAGIWNLFRVWPQMDEDGHVAREVFAW